MRRAGLWVYLSLSAAALVMCLLVPLTAGGRMSSSGLASWAILSVSVQVLLGVQFVARQVGRFGASLSRNMESARSRLNWRIEYETKNLFNSTRRLHADQVSSLERLVDFAKGTRLQGDRLVRRMHRQESLLEAQAAQLAALRDLVVELLAGQDAETPGRLDPDFERRLASNIGVGESLEAPSDMTSSRTEAV